MCPEEILTSMYVRNHIDTSFTMLLITRQGCKADLVLVRDSELTDNNDACVRGVSKTKAYSIATLCTELNYSQGQGIASPGAFQEGMCLVF